MGWLLEQFAELDIRRFERLGLPEAIFCPGKTTFQVVTLLGELVQSGVLSPILATRCDPATVEAICNEFPDAAVFPSPNDFPLALKTVVVASLGVRAEKVCIVTGGTTDLVAAGEAEGTLISCGIQVEIIPDVGVAGLHRLLSKISTIKQFDVVIVIAGMEGALASVLGGLVAAPIIAVPTSTGYGASAQGSTAMMAMLASCAPGVSVVGIDNGFGAACSAVRIANMLCLWQSIEET